jgi:hypothetical protein
VTSGDSIAIDYTGPTALTASKMNLAAVLSPLQIATTLRGDGRGMPLNSQVASGSLTATGAVTIAAPGAGFRLMLGAYSLSALVGASVVQLSVQTTKNGAAGQTVVLTDGVNGLSNLAGIFPIGEMSDPNTSASANITSTTGVVTATGVILYDVVPI